MKRKTAKAIGRLLAQIVVTTIVLLAIEISMEGMYLLGIPSKENVTKIMVSYPAVTEEAKVFTDAENIDLGLHLTGFLRYVPFEKCDNQEEPLITITYVLQNGQEVSLSANRNTVWWKGKAHAVKQKDIFVNLTEGIFFLRETVTE